MKYICYIIAQPHASEPPSAALDYIIHFHLRIGKSSSLLWTIHTEPRLTRMSCKLSETSRKLGSFSLWNLSPDVIINGVREVFLFLLTLQNRVGYYKNSSTVHIYTMCRFNHSIAYCFHSPLIVVRKLLKKISNIRYFLKVMHTV